MTSATRKWPVLLFMGLLAVSAVGLVVSANGYAALRLQSEIILSADALQSPLASGKVSEPPNLNMSESSSRSNMPSMIQDMNVNL
jgi:hypothetical protein